MYNKAAKEKGQLTYKSKPTRITLDLSAEILKAVWNYVLQALKVNNCQPRLLYPVKLSFKNNQWRNKGLPKKSIS
jgi:hypothetical protein